MKPHELGPVEDKHEEVLAAPQRYRLVIAGRDSGYNTLLVEAAKRAVAEGQHVVYMTATDDMLTQESYYYFDSWSRDVDELTQTSMGYLHLTTPPHLKFSPSLQGVVPDLVLLNEPLLFRWPTDRLLKNLRHFRRINPAVRFLIAGVPYIQPNKSVRRCFWYRLECLSAFYPETIQAWRWPSKDAYIERWKSYWDSYIIDRELRAMWVELMNNGTRIVERPSGTLPQLSR